MTEGEGAAGAAADEPIPLDSLAYGVDHLEAILVVYLGDAHVHAAWIRADAGYGPREIAVRLRDAYRACQGSLRALDLFAGGASSGSAADPVATLETQARTVLFRRIRAYLIITLFDVAMPLGMARYSSARIAAKLEPELPYPADAAGGAEKAAAVREAGRIEGLQRSTPPPADVEAKTLAFPPVGAPPRVSASRPPPPRATLTDLDRARRLLMFLEARAPEPHVARLRVALRAGLTPLALEHPEALRADAMILIETAVEDILGVERSELRRLV